ncbi:MAG: response regulator [Nitrospirota bacterium]
MKPYDNVLVVDDEPHAVRVLSMILKQEGYRVLESTTVDRAIDIIRNNDVHAVITDIKMPEKDGFTLLNTSRTMFRICRSFF